MTSEDSERITMALTNSLAAKAVWQTLAVAAASKGPETKRLILGALFAAQTRLDFDSTMTTGTDVGNVSALACEQIRRFRDGLADIATSPLPAPQARSAVRTTSTPAAT